MKVKEIIEILGVEPEKLINQLDNVGIEADLDTEIPQEVIKKLSKLYKKDINGKRRSNSISCRTNYEFPSCNCIYINLLCNLFTNM
jgi:hypothetical protein